MGRINQKRTRPQDEPIPFESLAPEEKALVFRHFPDFRPIDS
jgi:hypothetical protein